MLCTVRSSREGSAGPGDAGAITIEGVFGHGPFAEVGDPTAVTRSAGLVVVGGNLGWPQWNGRSVHSRSDRAVGWFPIGVYRRDTLACVRVLTTRWEVNSIAIHPSELFVAIGTGNYDGGWNFEGELLVHDLTTGRTASLLTSLRSVERVAWRDDETLQIDLAPPTDEDISDWTAIEHEHIELVSPHWASLDERSIDVDSLPSIGRPAQRTERTDVREAVAQEAAAHGSAWVLRRQVWALVAIDRGVVAGLESSIERWEGESGGSPTWQINLAGTCTQLFADSDGVVAAIWSEPGAQFRDRPTQAWTIDLTSGRTHVLADPGFPSVLTRRSDGRLLLRNSSHGQGARPAVVLDDSGVSTVDLGRYDLFNHYFDVRRSPELVVLVGDEPRPWEYKTVAEVRPSGTGWQVTRLFPLAWGEPRHLFGGPGVFLTDNLGAGLVHAGAVHDGSGLLQGNAFVVRRGYPDGRLMWHVALDNTVVAIDESDGLIVALTNLGEIVGIDATTGVVRWSQYRLEVGGSPVVPLSIALDSATRGWVGTMDGRILRIAWPDE